MGIIIDIVLIGIVLLSAFLGYKKGLVKLGAKLFASIIAIVLTIIIYRPISDMIINNTQFDEKIKDTVIQNTTNFLDENSHVSDPMIEQVKNGMLPEEAEKISKSVVYAVTAIVLFIVVKITLSIVISLIDFIVNLPILKEFNEIGGILYGIIRGVLIVCICIWLMGVFAKINPDSSLNDRIEESYLTKIIYENMLQFS